MKLIISLLLITGFSASSQTIKRTTFHDVGKTRVHEIYFVKKTTPAIKHGVYTEYYDNGNKKLETTFVNDVENGEQKKYNYDGTLAVTQTIKNGIIDGPTKKYYPSGRVQVECNAKNGKLDGTCKSYYENGMVEIESSFVDGIQQGKAYTYDEAGNLLATVDIKDGLKHGEEKLLSKKQAIVVRNKWVNDELIDSQNVHFDAWLLNGNDEFIKYIHGTRYGIESDWLELVRESNPMGGNRQYTGKIDETVSVQVQLRKKFTDPDNIYIMFRTVTDKNASTGKNYFQYFKVDFRFKEDAGLPDFYNFGISEHGMKLNLNATPLGTVCNNPYILISIATENPNPDADAVKEQGVLQVRGANSKQVAAAQEWNKNRIYGNPKQPDMIRVNTTCETVQQFIKLCKLFSGN
jgi:antitoxin component YwqK of YwqJK toxin-antitoxin module